MIGGVLARRRIEEYKTKKRERRGVESFLSTLGHLGESASVSWSLSGVVLARVRGALIPKRKMECADDE